ncbi:MAG: hypothetical protein QW331_04795, partial [Candidatus Woesearchaeota archaeon]
MKKKASVVAAVILVILVFIGIYSVTRIEKSEKLTGLAHINPNNAPKFNISEYNETFLWVANADNNFVTKFNRTAALLNITVGSTPFALAVDEGFVWV